jgi:hypothetical protein
LLWFDGNAAEFTNGTSFPIDFALQRIEIDGLPRLWPFSFFHRPLENRPRQLAGPLAHRFVPFCTGGFDGFAKPPSGLSDPRSLWRIFSSTAADHFWRSPKLCETIVCCGFFLAITLPPRRPSISWFDATQQRSDHTLDSTLPGPPQFWQTSPNTNATSANTGTYQSIA